MPRIRVLGGFEVTAADGTVARWQSRKARQLLKILVARRGVAVSRDTLLHLLWPDEAPQRLGNRFSVAATAVRRALDPAGTQPSGTYLETRGGLVRLRIERIDVDVERFLHSAHSALGSQAPTDARSAELAEALAAYRGDPLEDETDELWAEELRRDAHLAFFAVAHALGELADASGDHLSRVEAYGRILSADAYDQRAHEGLVDALTRLGSHSRAAAARADYVRRMGELGIPVHLPAP